MIFLLAAGVAGAHGLATEENPRRDPQVQLTVGGLARSYLIHVPPTLPSYAVPLILAFHGHGSQGAAMAGLTDFDRLADQRGFIVVYPNGIDRGWNDGRHTVKNPVDDIGFVAALLDQVEKRYRIDPRRVFASGMSNGATFTQRLGCELSEKFAAIAPVAGTMPTDIAAECHPAHPVSVLEISGTADPIMPYGGGEIASFGRRAGGTVLSNAATMDVWRRVDACAAAIPAAPLPSLTQDGTRVSRSGFRGCRDGSKVILLSVEGGGHAWPGGPQYLPAILIGKTSRQLDASAAIVDFFLAP